jgi:uncharacterized HAD superfamily protein
VVGVPRALGLLRVGFDLDGVIVALAEECLTWFKQHGHIAPTVTLEEVTQFNFEDCLPGVTAEISRQMFANGAVFRFAKPHYGGLRVLNELTAAGCETRIITARFGQSIREETAAWLAEHGAQYTQLHFARPEEKHLLARELGIDVFLEDKLCTARELAKECRLAGLIDMPWNRSPYPEARKLRRFYSWSEVGNYFGLSVEA